MTRTVVVAACDVETRVERRSVYVDGILRKVELFIGGEWRGPLELLARHRLVRDAWKTWTP